MRLWSILLILASAAFAATPEYRFRGSRGHSKLWRGYHNDTRLIGCCHDLRTISNINTTTDILTSAGHGLATNNRVWFFVNGADTLPSVVSKWQDYNVIVDTVDTFHLQETTYWTTLDFTDAGTGTIYVGTANGNCGTGITVELSVTPPSGVSGGFIEYSSPEIPSAGPLSLGTAACSGWWGLRYTATTGATTGVFTSTLNVKQGGATIATTTVDQDVADLTPVSRAASIIPVTLPDLSLWDNFMTYGAGRFCTNKAAPTEVFSFGVESQVWYYDGGWVYRQIADYTGDAEWNNCAVNISNQYRDYIVGAGGGIPKYKAYYNGLKRACVSCNPTYSSAADSLLSSTAVSTTSFFQGDDYMREQSLYVEGMVAQEKRTGTRNVNFDRILGYLLGFFDIQFGQLNPMVHQPYWNGIEMQALISAYEITGDPRIPYEVKRGLDWLWTNSYNSLYKGFPYSCYSYGPFCPNLANCTDASPTVNLFLAPAYTWMWRYTGDSTYQTRADALFSGAPKEAYWTASAATDALTFVGGHTWANGDGVYLDQHYDTTPLPSPLNDYTTYYVVNAASPTIQLAATVGGAPINITADGKGQIYYMTLFDITCTAADDTCNTSIAHKLQGGTDVVLQLFKPLAGSLPGGVTEKTWYYVINASGTSFQLSTTQGGAAVNLTSDGVARATVSGSQGIWAGKQFSEQFRWGIDYKNWRLGLRPNSP